MIDSKYKGQFGKEVEAITGFAKQVDLDNHIEDLANPHNVQSKQIPDGIDLKLIFENSLL